jgi:hypothetical protein
MLIAGSAASQTRQRSVVNRYVIAVVSGAVLLAGCGSTSQQPAAKQVEPSALDSLLLSPGEVDGVMGTTGIVHQPAAGDMNDHRDVVVNLNCLGVWQTDEAAVYENTGFNGVRRQSLRTPDNDLWNDFVVQSVVTYPSAGAAQKFFTDSAGRWSNCVNHRLNIAIGGAPSPGWQSGELSKTDTELTMPVTRQTGDQTRSCQRVLAIKSNAIIDAEACKPQPVAPATAVVDQIEAKFPH